MRKICSESAGKIYHLDEVCQVGAGDSWHEQPSGIQDVPSVAILLGTYQGKPFLAEQLESFAAQTYKGWRVWVSDDGSRDGTLEILNTYRMKWGPERLTILSGPRKGFGANFLFMACHSHILADYYAYSDQDDIWEADKLARAVSWLNATPKHLPALYCSRTLLIDSDGIQIGPSQLPSKPATFRNALAQTIAGGNTMVFNNAARSLLCQAGADVPIFAHDWWTYLAITGCGGYVFYDPRPSLRYRQHGGNVIGTRISLHNLITRIIKLRENRYRHFNDTNEMALASLQDKLTPENRSILAEFSKSRKSSLLPRLLGLWRSGIYRQRWIENVGLIILAIFRKI